MSLISPNLVQYLGDTLRLLILPVFDLFELFILSSSCALNLPTEQKHKKTFKDETAVH